MRLRTAFLTFWVGGLVAFAIVIAMSLPLTMTAVPGGIGDHQAAGTAAEVDRIHAAWSEAGLLNAARNSMIADLIFIGIYGLGSILAGTYYRSVGRGGLKVLGTVVLIAGVFFTATDYIETIAQFIQVSANMGQDDLASVAATVRPIKMFAWTVTFFGVLAAMVIRKKQQASS